MNKLTVLLVDDHEGFINAAMRHFRKIDWLQIVGSAGNGLEGTEAATYGESVRYGRDVATLEMETVAQHCPGTRFILIGYSQGAMILLEHERELARRGQLAGVVYFGNPNTAPRDPSTVGVAGGGDVALGLEGGDRERLGGGGGVW